MLVDLTEQQIMFIEHLSEFYFKNAEHGGGLIAVIANKGLMDALAIAKLKIEENKNETSMGKSRMEWIQ
mgnify:CR=1 FL=1